MAIKFIGALFPCNQESPRFDYSNKLNLQYLCDLVGAHEHASFDRLLYTNQWRSSFVFSGLQSIKNKNTLLYTREQPKLNCTYYVQKLGL